MSSQEQPGDGLQHRAEALWLVEEGVPYADIAHQTGVNLNTLKSWVRRENHRRTRQEVTQALIDDAPDSNEPATPAQMRTKLGKLQRLIDTSIGALEATLRQGVSKSPQSVAVSLEKCIAGSILLSKQLAELEERDIRINTEMGHVLGAVIRAVLVAAGVPVEYVADALREALGHASEGGDGIVVVSPLTTETTRTRVLEHFRDQFEVPALPEATDAVCGPPERQWETPVVSEIIHEDEEEVTGEVVVDENSLLARARAVKEKEGTGLPPTPHRESRWSRFDISPELTGGRSY